MNCPHCKSSLPIPPPRIRWWEMWQCSWCAGFYGVMLTSDVAFPVKPGGRLTLDRTVRLRDILRWVHARAGQPYVYAITGPTGMPMYVGKGTNDRVAQHERERGDDEKLALIASLRAEKVGPRYGIIAWCGSDDEAIEKEAKVIARYGRRVNRSGCLANFAAKEIEADEFTPAGVVPVVKDAPYWQPLSVIHPDNVDNPKLPMGERRSILFRCPGCNRKLEYLSRVAYRKCRCPECATEMIPHECERI